MMHSFPVSRRSLYFTGLISSIVVSILPVILTALVTTIVAAAEKIYAFDVIWFWALGVSATTLLFIGIAMISLMASGQIVTSIIFYGIFNFLYLMMEVAFRITASILMFGMTNSVRNISFNALTPVLFVDDACRIKVYKMYDGLGNIKTYTYTLGGTKYLLIYSDGVWKYLTNQDIRDLGNQYFKKGEIGPHCSNLVKKVVEEWENAEIIRDDITIVCVYF